MSATGCLVIGSDSGVGTGCVSAALLSLLGEDGPRACGVAAETALPVILVVGLRAACLDRALLAATQAQARGLRIVGWIGNTVDEQVPWPEENIHTLRLALQRRHGAPCLGIVPWLARPDPAAMAAFLDAARLRAAIVRRTENKPLHTVGS